MDNHYIAGLLRAGSSTDELDNINHCIGRFYTIFNTITLLLVLHCYTHTIATITSITSITIIVLRYNNINRIA